MRDKSVIRVRNWISRKRSLAKLSPKSRRAESGRSLRTRETRLADEQAFVLYEYEGTSSDK